MCHRDTTQFRHIHRYRRTTVVRTTIPKFGDEFVNLPNYKIMHDEIELGITMIEGCIPNQCEEPQITGKR